MEVPVWRRRLVVVIRSHLLCLSGENRGLEGPLMFADTVGLKKLRQGVPLRLELLDIAGK
jgi:hypothetical protein